MKALLVVAAICLLLAPALSYMAGCSADLKGGSQGDFELATRLWNQAVLALFVGMILGALGFLIGPPNPKRITRAAAWFFFGGLLSYVVAFNAEGWGIHSCL